MCCSEEKISLFDSIIVLVPSQKKATEIIPNRMEITFASKQERESAAHFNERSKKSRVHRGEVGR